jgi:hypothetical protein
LFIVEEAALARVGWQNEVDSDTDERRDSAFKDDYSDVIGQRLVLLNEVVDLQSHSHPRRPPRPSIPEMTPAAIKPPKQLDKLLPEYIMAIRTAISFRV